jgi:hypothetical protein
MFAQCSKKANHNLCTVEVILGKITLVVTSILMQNFTLIPNLRVLSASTTNLLG